MSSKKEPPPKPVHLGFRSDAALTKRIDRVAEAMKKAQFGTEVSRSAVLKALCELALPMLELNYFRNVSGMTDEEQRKWINEHLDFLREMADQLGYNDDD